MPKLSEEAKHERRERILAGSRRCFARFGYEGATVARLEHETGLSRGAIFNWFPSKEALFLELAAQENTRLLELIVAEGFEGFVHAVSKEDADWLAVYLEFGRRLRTSAELRDDLTPDEIGKFLGVVFDGMVTQRALGFEAPPPDLVVALIRDAVGGRAEPRATLGP